MHPNKRQAPDYRLEDLVGCGCLDDELGCLLAACVRARLNIVISGPASSGKTTMLNALCAHIPPGERRVIVGEVGGSDALDVVRVMARGPSTALTTVQASSADDALPQLAGLARQGAPAPGSGWVTETAEHGVDVLVHLDHRELTPHVAEVAAPMHNPGGSVGLCTVACREFDQPGGRLRHYPVSARIAARLRAQGEPIPAAFREDRFRRVTPAGPLARGRAAKHL